MGSTDHVRHQEGGLTARFCLQPSVKVCQIFLTSTRSLAWTNMSTTW